MCFELHDCVKIPHLFTCKEGRNVFLDGKVSNLTHWITVRCDVLLVCKGALNFGIGLWAVSNGIRRYSNKFVCLMMARG